MLIGTSTGGEMLQNELLILKIIVGVGFIGWMMLIYVHTVLLDNTSTKEKSRPKKPSRKKEEHTHYELPKAA